MDNQTLLIVRRNVARIIRETASELKSTAGAYSQWTDDPNEGLVRQRVAEQLFDFATSLESDLGNAS